MNQFKQNQALSSDQLAVLEADFRRLYPPAENHVYYVVVFLRSGIGTPVYLHSEFQLQSVIAQCLRNSFPFHVGHDFRMTLSDGYKAVL